MIKEHYIGLYLDTAARSINKTVPGDGIICMSALPTGATIYFDDETTRALPFLSDIPIYRNFKEFTIYLPVTEYMLSLTGGNPQINVIVVSKPHCLPTVPQNRIYLFNNIQISQPTAWWKLPHNNRLIRISSNGEANSNWRAVEIRSILAANKYSLVGLMCFYHARGMIPVCEFHHINTMEIVVPIGSVGTGYPQFNFEIFT